MHGDVSCVPLDGKPSRLGLAEAAGDTRRGHDGRTQEVGRPEASRVRRRGEPGPEEVAREPRAGGRGGCRGGGDLPGGDLRGCLLLRRRLEPGLEVPSGVRAGDRGVPALRLRLRLRLRRSGLLRLRPLACVWARGLGARRQQPQRPILLVLHLLWQEELRQVAAVERLWTENVDGEGVRVEKAGDLPLLRHHIGRRTPRGRAG
mmetsp:Transcript_37522/g.100556  ORF Transcript_37522/g.100556 Transcript_37522/m.100556 type:complete len:204 (-) Transcript_37522:1019-1630(-)